MERHKASEHWGRGAKTWALQPLKNSQITKFNMDEL